MPRIADGGGGGGGDTVVIDAQELRGLASTARGDIVEVDGTKNTVGGLIGGMDRRGWNAGAADGAWSSARGTLTNLSTNLEDQAKSLVWLAGLVELFETGQFAGGVPFGTPMQDPVNSYTGNLTHFEADVWLPTRGKIALGLARTYNSRDAHCGLFGPGWTSNLEARVDSLGDDFVIVTRGDGRRDLYTRHPDGSYVRPMGVRSDLTRQPGGGWKVTTNDGRWMMFSTSGALERLGDCNANVVTLDRNRTGRVVGVRDGVGRELTLTYSRTGVVSHLTDHAGRSVQYAYTDDRRVASVTSPGGGVTRYTYDAHGRLAQVTNGRGITGLAVSYDAEGRVMTQIDPLGGLSQFHYDGSVTTLTDPRGNPVRIAHDARGLVESITHAQGYITAFTYTDCGNRETMRDRSGGVWRYAYDGNCAPTRVEDPTGATQVNVYDRSGNITEHVDATGASWRYTYDERRNLVSTTDPLGAETTYEIDQWGQTVRAVDPDGVSATIGYNEAGQMVHLASAAGEERREYDEVGRLVARIDPTGRERRWRYDADGHLVERIDGPDSSVKLTCDAVGNVTSISAPDGAVIQYEYDAADRVVRVVDPVGGQTGFGYDANNNMTDVTDPAGYHVQFVFDALDRPTEFLDANGNHWRRSYDPRGDIVSATDARGGTSAWVRDPLGRVLEQTDRTGATTRYTYDPMGHIISVTDPLDRATRYTYDAAGRPVRREDALGRQSELEYTPGGRLTARIDSLGRRQRLLYDQAGRLQRIEDPLGGSTTYAYDAAGRRVRQTDRAGRAVQFAYDEQGRIAERIDPTGGVTRWTYDAAGQPGAIADPLGRQTRYSYDLTGRLASVTDPLGQTTAYRYDTRGSLFERLDALGRASRYTYDANGWLTSETDPLGRTTRVVLDGNGNWIERTDADGTRATARYDTENRVVNIASPDGTLVQLDYDTAGQPTRMLDGLGETRFTYDGLGQLTEVADAFDQRVHYSYDAAGRRQQVQYPDGRQVDYAYDELDRLVKVADARYTYADSRQPVGLEIADVGGWRLERDAVDRVRRLTYFAADQPAVAEYVYDYDAVGNVTLSCESGQAAAYAYDELNRLIAAGDERFAYDAVGNRVSADAGVDAADQLAEVAYDARGNPLEGPHGERYTWDDAGRLARVDLGDGTRVEYAYDGRGNLRRETRRDPAGGDSVRRFTLDLAAPLPRVLAETSSSGTRSYTYGLGLLGPTDTLEVRDVRGSVRGSVSEPDARAYSAWGIPTGATVGPFGFSGEVESANLVYLRSRWYQPATGRLLGRDPDPGDLFDPPSQHRYAYARNNPVSLADPSGMSSSSLAFPNDPWNPFGPFGPFSPYRGGQPGEPNDVPGEVPVWFRFVNAFGSAPATYFAEYANQQVEVIDGLFKQAGASFSKAVDYYQQSAAAFERAVVPSEWKIGRLPLFRDVRRGWYQGVGESAMAKGDDALSTGKYLQDSAEAMDDARPWLRPAAKALPFVGAAIDFGTTFYSTWQEDKGESTGTRIRHAATEGGAVAGGAAVGAWGGAAACASTGVLAVAAPGCAVVGGVIGGKVGEYAGKGLNWLGDHAFGWL